MKVRYLAGQYGFPRGFNHIATVAKGEKRLMEMGMDLLASGDLVGIYIPEGTETTFSSTAERGRIVGAVRLLPLPQGRTVRDYFYPEHESNPQWPIGWPCEVVLSPPLDVCPSLRSIVDVAYGPGQLQPFAAQLRSGPIKLIAKVADLVTKRLGVT